MLKQHDKELRALLNKYLYNKGVVIKYDAILKCLESDIIKYLSLKGKEEIKTIVQKKHVSVSNRITKQYLVKSDAPHIIRKELSSHLIDLVVIQKDYVDIEILKQFINMGRVNKSIMDRITTIHETNIFNIEISDK